MDKVTEFILQHGASRYDPVKAHEYYLRTRELQGRRSSSDLHSTAKKEGWAYTKKQVEDERKQTLIDAADSNTQAVTQLHDNAEKRRDEIREKLRQAIERIAGETSADRDKIASETEAAIAAVPEVPKGLSKEETAQRRAERADKIAQIRGEAGQKRSVSAYGSKLAKAGERDDAAAKRESVAGDLKGSLDKARKSYESMKEQIKAKYESELNREFDSIRANV